MLPASQADTGTNMYGRDNTFGGYSDKIVVREDFVLKIPAGLKPEVAAPILCAGVTTYSAMKHWGVKAGDKVGVIGLGGLGNMAVKLAKAMGAEVTVFTHTEEKLAEATRLGVKGVLESNEDALKRDRTLTIVGVLEPMKPVNNQTRAMQRTSVAGSIIGSIKETQEVLDFCAEHQIGPDIQVIAIQDINDTYKEVIEGNVRFRYVIDMASLKLDEAD